MLTPGEADSGRMQVLRQTQGSEQGQRQPPRGAGSALPRPLCWAVHRSAAARVLAAKDSLRRSCPESWELRPLSSPAGLAHEWGLRAWRQWLVASSPASF